jgi:hypothetical protein
MLLEFCTDGSMSAHGKKFSILLFLFHIIPVLLRASELGAVLKKLITCCDYKDSVII